MQSKFAMFEFNVKKSLENAIKGLTKPLDRKKGKWKKKLFDKRN